MNELFVVNDMNGALSLARTMSESGLIPKRFQGRPNDILIAMMWAKNLDVPVLQMLQGLSVINGTPSIFGDMAIALVSRSGLLTDLHEKIINDNKGLRAMCVAYRKGRQSPIIYEYSLEDAKQADLLGKDNWKHHPKRMLQMRARSYVLRNGFPDVLMGLDVDGSMSDMPAGNKAEFEDADVISAPMPKQIEQAKPEILEPVSKQSAEKVVVESVVEQTGRKMAAAEFTDTLTLIKNAKNIDELTQAWRDTPKDLRDTMMDRFMERHSELQMEALQEQHKREEQVNEKKENNEPIKGQELF